MKYLLSLPILFVSFFLYMFVYAKATKIEVHNITLRVPKEDHPLRLFFISDIHRRIISDCLISKIVNKVDLIIIGGDLAEKGVPLKRIQENLSKLKSIAPIYFVWGNNDREVGEEQLREVIRNEGGVILENDSVSICSKKSKWVLCAVDDPSSQNLDLSKTFSNVSPSDIVIFVTHSPFVFKKAKKLYNPHVMLAGHTHGGQIRVGRFGLYKKGRLEIESDRATLISNGFGTTLMPLRLGARPECHILNISGTLTTKE